MVKKTPRITRKKACCDIFEAHELRFACDECCIVLNPLQSKSKRSKDSVQNNCQKLCEAKKSFSYHLGIVLKHKETHNYLCFPRGIVFSNEHKHINISKDNANAVEEEKNRKMSVPRFDFNLSQNTRTISSLSSSHVLEI